MMDAAKRQSKPFVSSIKSSKAALIALNIFFAVLAVIGQVGQNVTLPLWANAVSSNCSYYRNNSIVKENMDVFFILSFAALSFVIVFGFTTLLAMVFDFQSIKRSAKFPQWQLVLIGCCDAFNGILIVFSSPPFRTAPFLQAILGNVVIPLTIILRLLILRKKPTILKLVSAGIVIVGLVLSLIPVIFGLDADSADKKKEWLLQSTASRILWPLCFMIGFAPATLMNVIEEKSLKDTRKVNLLYLLFWTSLYQLITIWLFFWLDIIHNFGFANDIHEFGENYWFSIKCFFGQETCDLTPGLRGSTFIIMYVISYIGSGLLLRYAEGATYLAIVQSLVTPLGALFWSIFSTDHCGGFEWDPHADSLTYFSIGGIVMIVPAILLYNVRTQSFDQFMSQVKDFFSNKKKNIYRSTYAVIETDNECSPLLN